MRKTDLGQLTIFVIVTATTACDNVGWGGVALSIQPPSERSGEAAAEAADTTVLPEGPILYAAAIDDETATLRPLVELRGDSLHAVEATGDRLLFNTRFIDREYRPGSEFVLLSHGTRVGTVAVQEALAADASFCPQAPAARGVAELTASAMRRPPRGAPPRPASFLALRKEPLSPRPHGPYPDAQIDGAMRAASFEIALAELRARGATNPPDWIRARADVTPLPTAGTARAFAATYLFRDDLARELPPSAGYSLFFIAEEGQAGFAPTYVWFRRYAARDKAAPRFYDHLDLDDDGNDEIVLEVFGAERAWFAILDRSGGSWRLVYEDPCGAALATDQSARE